MGIVVIGLKNQYSITRAWPEEDSAGYKTFCNSAELQNILYWGRRGKTGCGDGIIFCGIR